MRFLLTFIGVFLLGIIWVIKGPRRVSPLLLPLAGLGAVVAVTTLLSRFPERSELAVVSWAVIIVFFFIFSDLNHPLLEDLILYGVTALALIGIGQMAVNIVDVAAGRLAANFLTLRVPSLTSHANVFAVHLLPGMFLAVHRLRTRPEQRWLPAGILIILYTALVMTFSRAGWLALALGFGTVIVLSKPLRETVLKRWRLALPLIAIAIITSPFVTRPALEAVELAVSAGDPASAGDIAQVAVRSSGRLRVWRSAWELFLERPLAGNGPWTFGALYESPRPEAMFWGHAHNTYLNTAAEQGILGLLALLAFGLVALWRVWKGWQDDTQHEQALLTGGLLLTFAVNGGFELVIGPPGITLLFLITWNRLYPDFWEVNETRQRRLLIGSVLLAVLMLIPMLR